MASQLTDKQAKFVEHRLAGKAQAEAAKLAGYRGKPQNMDKIGSQVEAIPKVADAIRAGRKEINQHLRLDAERVLLEVSRIATFDPRKLEDEDGRPIPLHKLDDHTAACIASVEISTVGSDDNEVVRTYKYKAWDKNSAADKLMKHLGLYEQDNKQKNESLAEALMAGINRTKDMA